MMDMSKETIRWRGAAAALALLGMASTASAQSAGGGVRPAQRDSFIVRVIDGTVKGRVDSIMAVMRLLQDEPVTSPQSERLRRELELMTRALSEAHGGPVRIMVGRPSELETRRFNGWIGITTEPVPHHEEWNSDGYFVRYFRYPAIMSVEPNSPAQRAGVAPGDVLLAYDGLDVVNRLLNVSQLITPEKKLAVTVRREGEKHEFNMVVEKAPARIFERRIEEVIAGSAPQRVRGSAVAVGPGSAPRPAMAGRVEEAGVMPSFFTMTRAGMFGASMYPLKPELAKVLKLDAGLLVDEVPEPTPAYKAGLRTGDIIVSVAGRAVRTVGELRVRSAQADDRTITLQIIREGKPRAITVKW
jgi:C-terminal processing protease CtpA/Prc